ncbi:MAG: M4 family metallopeptidase [Hyalangium sp.]|uniref:M4 family metallopeptidase n=1 Tax=Hyalangium sp. TaxID=2028555 RepID=UPI003899F89B
MSTKFLKTFCAAWLGLAYAACGTTEQQVDANDLMTSAEEKDGTDIQQALNSIGNAHVLGTNEKDGVPYYVTGNFGVAKASAMGLAPVDAKATVQDSLAAAAPIFRLRAENLAFKSMTSDQGGQHLRFQQLKNGLPVVNGELILHVDAKGNVFAANGDARDTQSGMTTQTLVKPQIAADAAALLASKQTEALDKSAKAERLVYVRDSSGELVLAHEVRVTGHAANGLPVNNLVYVDAKSGRIALVAPQIHTALSRKVYTANNGTTTPGTLKRTEGQAATGDSALDTNYDLLGYVYNCYKTNFNRDSFDNAGATYISTVHYDVNYVNAYWDGTQMVYGDGDGVDSISLAIDPDVTAHELTHAVTERTSNLTYSGQSGGLNEAMSDTFGAICQSWNTGTWSTAADIWKVGEFVWTPGTAGDALRYMDDPAKDGASLDWAPDESGQDVHYTSGPPNLAFALLSKGGTHPRGKSSNVVTGIGVQKAGQIWYTANTSIFTSSTTYEQAKTYTEQAATQLGYTAEVASVTAAWQAVGVGIPPPPPVDLSNGVAVTGLSGSTGAKKYYRLAVPAGQGSLTFTISGGTGDADMYVKFGASPTTSTYDCRPFVGGNSETCSFTNPTAGDWYVMLNAYSTYSGVTLTGTYGTGGGGGGGGGTPLTNGVASAQYSGAASSMTCFTLAVPAGKTSLVFNQAGASGNTGDADLYVKFGALPTTTTYDCRPYTAGNTESCSFTSPTAGTWYACSRGYTAFTKVTMKGTYK